ncbi:MAG: tetratricopeptide repeat protein [Desulfuromonas sp.]|nr:tetratricopeptide repeat protein [Desulfuromonas sp.]
MSRIAFPQAFLLCLVVTAALYARTFGFDWTYDDFMVIVDNSDVLSWKNFLADSYPGRPLRELTYLFDHALFGMSPAGWRIQQLLWHALCASLLFELCRTLSGQARIGAFAALVFLLHPLQVEVVANISHRKDSLVLAFCLLALLAWIRSFAGFRPGWWRAGAVLALGMALLAKENAIVLPLLWLLYEWQFVPAEKRFLLKLPKAAIAYPLGTVVVVGVWCWQQGGVAYCRTYAGHLLGKLEYFGPAQLDTYLRAMFKSWAFMAVRLVWPADLAVEYLYPVPGSWFDPWVLGGLAFITGMLALLVHGLHCGRPWQAFWSGWLIAFWLPTSNLWPMVYPAADRYLYPFIAGVAALTAWWLHNLARRDGAYLAIALGICLPLAVVSWHQSGFWQNDDVLHRHALDVSPQSSFLNNELGKIAEKRGDDPAAMAYFRAALERNPRNAAAHYNLGQALERNGFLPMALEHYREFLRDDTPAYREAAGALAERLRRQHGLNVKSQ